jgi:hypothetical protein
VLRRSASADVVAAHPTITLFLPSEQFMSLIKEHPAILGVLYDLAVKRDAETQSAVGQESTNADDYVLV